MIVSSFQYRGLELTNGLKVLLVSDSTTDKSAAALDVNAGRQHVDSEFLWLFVSGQLHLYALPSHDVKTTYLIHSKFVYLGHLMDPWDLPGTAHFCEHMLFLGTDKYPSENEYSKVCRSCSIQRWPICVWINFTALQFSLFLLMLEQQTRIQPPTILIIISTSSRISWRFAWH